MHLYGKRRISKWLKPVSIFIIPHGGLRSLRFSFPVWLIAAGAFAWTGLTLWAGYSAGRHFDYGMTLADNKILRKKMLLISEQAKESLDYLAMTKKADLQLRKVLGITPTETDENGIGGPSERDMAAFRKQLTSKAAEIKEETLTNYLKEVKNEAASRLSSYSEITVFLADNHNNARATPAMWPAPGRISSPFGYRFHPLKRGRYFHSGIDITNEAGTPIHVTADGVVRYAGWAQGYGLCVVVDHGYGYSTLYGHMSQTKVKKGKRVKRGNIIGLMGSTGESTGNHVHYEVWIAGVPRNPMPFLSKSTKAEENFSTLFDGIFPKL